MAKEYKTVDSAGQDDREALQQLMDKVNELALDDWRAVNFFIRSGFNQFFVLMEREAPNTERNGTQS
jgi:hypothetical protein